MAFKGSSDKQLHTFKKGRLSSLKNLLHFSLTTLFFVGLIGITAFVTSMVEANSRAKSAGLAAHADQTATKPAPKQSNKRQQSNGAKPTTNIPADPTVSKQPATLIQQSSSLKQEAEPKCNEIMAQDATKTYELKLREEDARHKNVMSKLNSMLQFVNPLNLAKQVQLTQLKLDEKDKHQNILNSLLDTYTSSLDSVHCPTNIYLEP